jgi:hypothetical protein
LFNDVSANIAHFLPEGFYLFMQRKSYFRCRFGYLLSFRRFHGSYYSYLLCCCSLFSGFLCLPASFNSYRFGSQRSVGYSFPRLQLINCCCCCFAGYYCFRTWLRHSRFLPSSFS